MKKKKKELKNFLFDYTCIVYSLWGVRNQKATSFNNKDCNYTQEKNKNKTK